MVVLQGPSIPNPVFKTIKICIFCNPKFKAKLPIKRRGIFINSVREKERERLSITFTSNSKREFVPCDQVSPLLVVYCSLFLHTSNS